MGLVIFVKNLNDVEFLWLEDEELNYCWLCKDEETEILIDFSPLCSVCFEALNGESLEILEKRLKESNNL